MINTRFADLRALTQGKRVHQNTNGIDCSVFRPHLEARASSALYRVCWLLRLEGNHKVTRLDERGSFLASEYDALCTLCVHYDVFDCSAVAAFRCPLPSPAPPAFP